jgi:hypothetical protein
MEHAWVELIAIATKLVQTIPLSTTRPQVPDPHRVLTNRSDEVPRSIPAHRMYRLGMSLHKDINKYNIWVNTVPWSNNVYLMVDVGTTISNMSLHNHWSFKLLSSSSSFEEIQCDFTPYPPLLRLDRLWQIPAGYGRKFLSQHQKLTQHSQLLLQATFPAAAEISFVSYHPASSVQVVSTIILNLK